MDDIIQAQELARVLVENHTAACVNLVPQVISVFHWEDKLQVENEILMIIKTTEAKAADVQALLEEHHSYEVPEMVEFDGIVLSSSYWDWINDWLS